MADEVYDKGLAALVKQMGQTAAAPELLKLNSKDIAILAAKDEQGNIEAKSLKPLLDEYLDAPERILGSATALTIKSFTDLVNRHKSPDTAIFGVVDPRNPSLLAVIDYHTIDHKPKFLEHRIKFDFPMNKDFVKWRDNSAKFMTQNDFAELVEDRVANLAAPTGGEISQYESLFQTKFATPAEMFTLSRGLSARVEQVVKEAVVISSGEAEMIFTEEHKESGGGSKLTVPGLFVVSVPIFDQGEPVRFIARLRYRIKEGRVLWAFIFYDFDNMYAERVRGDFLEVEKETSLPVYEGKPEA